MGYLSRERDDAEQRLAGGVRTRWVAVATLFALVALSAALFVAFTRSVELSDRFVRQDERVLVARYLDRVTEGAVHDQLGQIGWDDAMNHAVITNDTAWQDREFGQFLWANFTTDATYLVAPDGGLLRAWRNGRPVSDEQYRSLRRQVGGLIAQSMRSDNELGQASALHRLADGTMWPINRFGIPRVRWAGAVVLRDGRPAIMTVASIVPDRTPGLLKRVPNYVVAINDFNSGVVRQMGRDLHLSHISFSIDAAGQGGRNAIPVFGGDGSRIGWLGWTAKTPGGTIIDWSAPLFWTWIVFFVAALIGGTIILRRAYRLAHELIASEAQAQHNALHDPMSGLPNRMHYMQRLRTDLSACVDGRCEGDVFVAYIDLDGFKVVNDTLGHHVGDELVRQVAVRLRRCLLPGDFVSRFGGDEFVVLRHAEGGCSAADDLGEQIMALMKEPFVISGKNVEVTCSCGISWGPSQSEDPGELLRRADIALYRAKQRGRARYRRFTRDMDASIKLRLEMEVELRRAIARDELSVAYQPIVSTTTGAIVGVEALLRWEHPERGDIRPGLFVPIAEQAGLMNALGNWMLRHVFTECRDWPTCDISVNLSPLQIMSGDFVQTMARILGSTGIDPRRVVLEITEGVMLDRSDHVLAVLRELGRMGFRIALDDFGTGYSSLSYLRSFQFDRIKIDRSFVSNIETDADAHSILCAIASLGQTLRMKVVAEGVETEKQNLLVQQAGCDLIQGHLYWRAMPAANLLALLDHNTGRLRKVS